MKNLSTWKKVIIAILVIGCGIAIWSLTTRDTVATEANGSFKQQTLKYKVFVVDTNNVPRPGIKIIATSSTSAATVTNAKPTNEKGIGEFQVITQRCDTTTLTINANLNDLWGVKIIHLIIGNDSYLSTPPCDTLNPLKIIIK